MERLKEFSDGSFIEFGEGRFDPWCVYLTRPAIARHAPRDVWYFGELKRIGASFGEQRLYSDFVQIYEYTGPRVNQNMWPGISRLSQFYGADALTVDIILSVIYAGMVSEERKERAILKKRVKRLGVYQTLILGFEPELAANFSRGKGWRELDKICSDAGF